MKVPNLPFHHFDELYSSVAQDLRNLLEEPMTEKNYVQKFSFFLHLNELEQQGFLETHTMDGGVVLQVEPGG